MNTLHYKQQLTSIKKSMPKNDKPAMREALNDYTDSLIRDIDTEVMRGKATQRRGEQVKRALINHCIKLHP